MLSLDLVIILSCTPDTFPPHTHSLLSPWNSGGMGEDLSGSFISNTSTGDGGRGLGAEVLTFFYELLISSRGILVSAATFGPSLLQWPQEFASGVHRIGHKSFSSEGFKNGNFFWKKNPQSPAVLHGGRGVGSWEPKEHKTLGGMRSDNKKCGVLAAARLTVWS